MPPSGRIGAAFGDDGPTVFSSITRVRLAFGFRSARCAIELADGVSANFDDAVLCAFAYLRVRRRRPAP